MITIRVMVLFSRLVDVVAVHCPRAATAPGTDAGSASDGGSSLALPGWRLYAAYGSNMDPAQMLQRCPPSPVAGTGWLAGWRLTFGGEDLGWEGALATGRRGPGPGRCSSRSTT